MTDLKKAINQLAAKGIEFLCTHPGPAGSDRVSLSAEEMTRYLDDPEAVIAAKYGVHKEDYLAWQDANYIVYCAGTTRAKRPCRRIVENGCGVGLKEWVAMQGTCCPVH